MIFQIRFGGKKWKVLANNGAMNSVFTGQWQILGSGIGTRKYDGERTPRRGCAMFPVCNRGAMTQRGSILVVDDEPCVREVCCQCLSLAGYRVDESASGEEALAAVTLHTYDLLILDLQMRGISGLATFRRLRLLAPGAKAVVITGAAAAFESELDVARQDGLIGVLTKPFTLQELQTLVESAFRAKAEAA